MEWSSNESTDQSLEDSSRIMDFDSPYICDREKEMATLEDALKQSTKSLQVVWIKGGSGVGKTALVENLFVGNACATFCSGRFQKSCPTTPFSALAEVLTQLYATLEVRKTHFQLTSDDALVLSSLVPQMVRKLKPDTEKVALNFHPEWGLERLKQAFRSFLKGVCEALNSPLVITLDDLQWADTDSLSILKDSITELEKTPLLFIGLYRDNEITDSHVVTRFVREINKVNSLRNVTIVVSNLDKAAMNQLVAHIMNISTSQVRPLSDLIHKKTEGNCFYAITMLRHIHKKRLVYTSSKTYQWEWSLAKIHEEVSVSDNVVEMLNQRLAALDVSVYNALQIAAFIGTVIDTRLFETLLPVIGSSPHDLSIQEVLRIAEKANLVEISPDQSYFKFSQESIVASIHGTFPETMIKALHLKIGQTLQSLMMADESHTTENKDSWQLILAHQLNLGSDLIVDECEREELCRINLIAARNLLKRSAFKMSLSFLESALRLLENDRWEEQYDLTLDLSNLYSFVLFSNGKSEESLVIVEEIYSHSKILDDRYHAFTIHVNVLASTGQLEACLNVGINILNQFGYPSIPRKPGVFRHIIPGIVIVKRLLKGMTDDDLLSLPVCTDQKILVITKLLSILIPVAHHSDEKNLIPVLVCRLFQTQLVRGSVPGSSGVFAGYGVLLAASGDFNGAIRFANLSKRLMEHVGEDPKTLIVVHGLLLHLKRPIIESVSTTLRAYRMAFSQGELMYAAMGANMHILIRYSSGLPLESILKDGIAFCRQFQKYDLQLSLTSILAKLRVVAELVARPTDLSEFVGDAIDDKTFEHFVQQGESAHMNLAYIWMFNMEARYYLGDMVSALEYAEKVRKSRVLDHGAFSFSIEQYLIGALISIHHWRSTGKLRFWKLVRKYHRQLMSWAKKGNLNTLHLITLVDAEMSVGKARPEAVLHLYEKAISAAIRCGFVHHAALANELMGKFWLTISDESRDYWSNFYLLKAKELYKDWNAVVKVNQIDKQIGAADSLSRCEGSNSTPLSSTYIAGRSREMDIAEVETRHSYCALPIQPSRTNTVSFQR